MTPPSAEPLRETRTAAGRARRAARSAEDEAARHERLHQTRGLRIGESPDGHVEIRGRFTPAAFAGVNSIIDAHMKTRVELARRDGTRDSWDAYRADAFLDAITAGATRQTTAATTPTSSTAASPVAAGATPDPSQPATSGTYPIDDRGRLFSPGSEITEAQGLDPKVDWNLVILVILVILVDGIVLKRGYAAPGETCEIPGIGTIPVAWIETLLPGVHTEMLIHDSIDIRAYATTTRHRTRPVDLAVHVRDRDCTVPRCHLEVTELDHITDTPTPTTPPSPTSTACATTTTTTRPTATPPSPATTRTGTGGPPTPTPKPPHHSPPPSAPT